MLNSWMTDLFAVQITQLHTYVCALMWLIGRSLMHLSAAETAYKPQRQIAIQRHFANLAVVVSGVVAVVRRGFAVQTNRFRSFGCCNATVSVKGVVVRSFYWQVNKQVTFALIANLLIMALLQSPGSLHFSCI